MDQSSREILCQLDILYSTPRDTELTADVFRPAVTQGPVPAVIFLHGGGWQAGDKASGHQWARLLAKAGIATLCIRYRLAGKQTKAFPEALEDVRAAMRYVRSRPETFNTEKIGLFGASAGAHLAALAALADAMNDTPAACPRAVVCAYGIYDLDSQWHHECEVRPENNLVETFLGQPPAVNPELYKEASPLHYLRQAEPCSPAFFLTWGLKDKVVKPTQSEAFLRAAIAKGFRTESFIVPEAGHFWLAQAIEDPQTPSARLAPLVLEFLSRELG